ncbi:MAG: glycosyltransferase family 4 protein, partial [Candidatus Bathyarchaeota archaeon]
GLDSVADLLYTSSCIDEVRSKRPHIIYSFPHKFDRYPLKLAKTLHVPLVVEMWEDYAQFGVENMTAMGIPQPSIIRQTKRAYSWMTDIAGQADKVIVPATVFLERLCQLGVEKSKISVVPVCVRPTPSSDPNLMRRKHNIKPGEKMVFHVGNRSPWHDLITLLESLKQIKSRTCVIISGGRPESSSNQEFQNARVLYTGKVTSAELGAYLSAADICVAPYYFTKPSGFFPAKIIRYMLAGKAVVTTDLPEIREMLKGEPAGLLVPPKDPKALAEALDYLAENDEERLKMGAKAREIAEDNYLTRHHTNQLLKIFEECVFSSKRPISQPYCHLNKISLNLGAFTLSFRAPRKS